jgi:hypothetical protein
MQYNVPLQHFFLFIQIYLAGNNGVRIACQIDHITHFIKEFFWAAIVANITKADIPVFIDHKFSWYTCNPESAYYF